MASLFGKSKTPALPDLSAERSEASERERLRRAQQSGRTSTVTGGTIGSPLQQKKALGA